MIVIAPNEFEGATGEISDLSPSGKFVVVNLYNHGRHSMHLSDVEYNQYADQEEDDWYDDADEFGKPGSEFFPEGFQDFNKVEPYAVCLAGRPVKKFDYYEDARRFHDNWKKKLYNQGEKAKADTITLMPLNLDEATPRHFGPKGAGTELARQTRDAELDRKFNTPDQLKKDADYRAYRAGIKKAKVQVKKSQVKEFAPGGIYKPPVIPREPGKGPFEDDGRSTTVSKVQQLLDAGKSVFVLLPGAKGRAVGTQVGDDHSWLNVQYKGWKDPKTRSRSRLTVNLNADDDASLKLTPGSQFTDNKDRPFDYTLSGEAKTSGRGLWEQGVAEGDDLTHAGQDVMVWLGPPTNNPPRDDKKYWIRGKLDSTEMHNGSMRANVMTAKGMYNPELSRVFKAEQGVAEASYINGHVEDPESLRWKQTSMSYEQAVAKFGKNNVKQDGKNRLGQKIVMVLVPLGEQAETDYQKKRQRERDVDAGKPVAKQRQSKMTDYQKRRAQQKREMELGESQDTSGVEQAILHRIMVAHTDLLRQFGPEKVMQAAEEVAYGVGDVDEIGTSDVSAWVHEVKRILGAE